MATFSAELHKAAAGSHSQPINKEGALFRYGEREILAEYGKSKKIDEVGLSYAYGELYVQVER